TLAWWTTCTVLRRGSQPGPGASAHAAVGGRTSKGLAPRQQLLCPPPRSLPVVPVRQHQREVCPLAGGVNTPIRPITGRPSLPPSSFPLCRTVPPCGGPTAGDGTGLPPFRGCARVG